MPTLCSNFEHSETLSKYIKFSIKVKFFLLQYTYKLCITLLVFCSLWCKTQSQWQPASCCQSNKHLPLVSETFCFLFNNKNNQNMNFLTFSPCVILCEVSLLICSCSFCWLCCRLRVSLSCSAVCCWLCSCWRSSSTILSFAATLCFR